MSLEQRKKESRKDKAKQKTHKTLVEKKENGELARNPEVAEGFATAIRNAERNNQEVKQSISVER